MESSLFTQVSLVIAAVAVVSIIMRLLRQPLIMGYILTGILVGPSMLNLVHDHEAFQSFSEIGITLLLFIIGLGLNAAVIKRLGKVSLLTAGAILLLIGAAGYAAGLGLGFDSNTSIILGVALFFSSTIIILKMLSDKHELNRLYGQIAIGVILIDDVVACLALVAVAMLTTSGASSSVMLLLGGKAVLLAAGLNLVGRYVMPRLGKFFAKSQETLFIFSIGWGLCVASLFDIAGFSHEVGALFAGITLASLPYATQMAARLKPLRDFFIVLFFVTLGETFTFGAIKESLVPAIILSMIVMIGKPIFVMGTLGALRYTRLTSFKTAVHLSQISEFSIILIIYAASTGFVDDRIVPIVTLVALITIGISTYLMKYDDELYRRFEKYLKLFERKTAHEPKARHAVHSVILVGYHKGGHEFLKVFRELKKRYLVVDYDPDVIDHLEQQGIRHAYGDATDEEFLEEISASRAELVVSTIADVDSNLLTLRYLRHHNPQTSFICHASTYEEAAKLYEHGASYVSLPHYLGTERVSAFIKKNGTSHQALQNYRRKHLITIGRNALDAADIHN